ncbi:energy transducer TonB [Leisingera sp. M523]|uniref:energy transducer TonB n=1 Tax=Leisingera sp. M523 TaxID=2867013 RepID=UPI0021A363F9|nr:energy transducer TonB [Leisingera sp. M523]UWQ28144.1 TonB C-terminal domain-containing protein [Leisingera sp. M523]
MKRAAEFTVFAGIAVLIHVALFARVPGSGAQSSGAGGTAMVSIQAAPEAVVEMAEAWEKPPQTSPQIATQSVEPLPPANVPSLPQLALDQAPRAAAQIAIPAPARTDNLQIDTAPPSPPKPQKPEPKPEPQQARKSEQASAGQAEQRAAGSGGGAQAGQSGGAQVATAESGRRAKLRSIWGAKIRARVERRKRYPAGASGQGQVVVRLTVSRSGQLLSHRIARSSGVAAFDQAALQAVARAGKFPAAPKKLQINQISFNLPMSFSK